MVVPAIALCHGSSAEFGTPHHQGGVEKASLLQVSQEFPIKAEMVARISTDQASNEVNMESFLAKTMMNDIEVKILPGFVYTCVLLGIPVLLTVGQLFAKLGAARSEGEAKTS